jgi:hypothetical protein
MNHGQTQEQEFVASMRAVAALATALDRAGMLNDAERENAAYAARVVAASDARLRGPEAGDRLAELLAGDRAMASRLTSPLPGHAHPPKRLTDTSRGRLLDRLTGGGRS